MTTTALWVALVALSHPVPTISHHSGKIYQQEIVNYWSEMYKVPQWFATAITREESSFRVKLETKTWVGKGKHRHSVVLSHGMLQTNPKYDLEFASFAGVKHFDWRNPSQSAHVGIAHLADLMGYFRGDLMLTAACYNAGVNRIRSGRQIPDETVVYLGRVFG